jgi:hypothetical protein
MHLIQYIGDRIAERRMMMGLEGVLRTYLIEAEINRIYSRPRVQYSVHGYKAPHTTRNRLEKRKLTRQYSNEYLEHLASGIRYRSQPAISGLMKGLYDLRDSYRNRIFKDYFARPALFRTKSREFMRIAETRLQNHDRFRALERRLERLEGRVYTDRNYASAYTSGSPAKAHSAMAEEIVREYSTNYSKNLKAIAQSLSVKYNKPISHSSMRRIARQQLGNVSRRDWSAERAYALRRHSKKSRKVIK